jgi:exopolysaccharide biosynthesis protein
LLFIAIARPDGTPKVEMKQIRSTADLTGYEEQVIPCSSGYIVNNGKSTATTPNHNPDISVSAPRSVVGVTADGKVVMMEVDGRQTISVGFTTYEIAEMMIDLGCVYACNCDGGGSSQFLSKRPGADLEVVNSPSDGSPRETTSGIMFVSTAPADGQFAVAHISTSDKYYTPGSTVEFDAVGTDLVG